MRTIKRHAQSRAVDLRCAWSGYCVQDALTYPRENPYGKENCTFAVDCVGVPCNVACTSGKWTVSRFSGVSGNTRSVTTVPGGIPVAWISTSTGVALLIVTSGNVNDPEG